MTVTEALELDERRLGKEVALRTQLGLEDDPAWVRAVLANPGSVIRHAGAPVLMSPEEAAAWDRRVASQSQLAEALNEYGDLHSGEWGGWYVSRDSPGVVVLLTDHVAEHQAALRALISTDVGPIEFRQVTWGYTKLIALRNSVWRDVDWFDTIGVRLVEAEVDKTMNRVRIRIRTPRPDKGPEAVAATLEHFDGADWMAVSTQTDPFAWLGVGTLSVTVVDQFGRPVPNLTCQIFPAVYGAAGDSTIMDTDEQGRCRWTGRFAVAATTYGIEVRRRLDEPVLGTAHATVLPKEETSIGISIVVE